MPGNRALLREIPFQPKRELVAHYKDRLLNTHYRPDLMVYDTIIVVLKALTDLNADHEAQIFNYLRIARQQVGYLLNFGKKGGLQWKRFILSDLHPAAEKDGERNANRH